MRVMIIGAGVVGVTTAWVLARRGHEVEVVDSLDGPAQETSRANAGQRSYGHVSPWAAPDMIGVGLRGLLSRYGPLKVGFPPSMRTIGFLARTARYSWTPGVYERNNTAMLRLAAFSREAFLRIEREASPDFDGDHLGLLEVTNDPSGDGGLKAKAAALADLGIEHEWLTPENVTHQEPSLAGRSLTRALLIPGDGTGDCHAFTRSLSRSCAELGVRFRYNTEVSGWALEGASVEGVHLRHADHSVDTANPERIVLCAGCQSRSLAWRLGLRLPIYPVKGYSLTAPVQDPERAPRSTLVDLDHKVAITRLGDHMRVTGFAELNGFNRGMPETRLEVLREAVNSCYPGAADFTNAEPWTGFRPMLPDGPPALGQTRLDNLFINSGHGTFGWTLSAGCAEIMGQLMDGEPPAVDLSAFQPERFG